MSSLIFTVEKVDGEAVFDVNPKERYCFMDGMNLLEANGVRINIVMQKPGPGFFFAFADYCDEKAEAVLVVCEQKNLVGAYFRR